MARIKTGLVIDIGRHTIPVVVDSTGEFWAEWEGDSYRSSTFKGLRAKLMPKVREDAKRCELPALLRDYSNEWSEIILVGIHGDNGNVLYRDKDAKTHQLSRRDRRVFRLLTPAEFREHDRLAEKVKAAVKTLNTWLAAHAIEPGKAVREAIGLPPEERDKRRKFDDEDDDIDYT